MTFMIVRFRFVVFFIARSTPCEELLCSLLLAFPEDLNLAARRGSIMSASFHRSIGLFLRIAGGFAISIGVAFASTVTIPAGTGTLTFTRTQTTQTEKCFVNGRWINGTLTKYYDGGFSYKDSSSVVTGLAGTDLYLIDSCPDGVSGGAQKTLTSAILDVVYDNTNDYTGAVVGFRPHGYVNPKYKILGVTYAPPGPASSVNYTNSTTLSSTSDTKKTFSTAFQQSVTTKVNAIVKGWSSGISSTSTTSYTQTSFTSSSTTVSKTTALSDVTYGPSNAYVGLNHDYDIVWIMLNPVQLFTLIEDTGYNVTSVEWDGYGYSTLDPVNAMDVYPVYVGWMNGDIAMTSSQSQPLQRAWAAPEAWPAGQGPALTSADFQAIGQADPYWQCTPNPSACPTTVDGTRYTVTLNQDLIYLQAPVGGQPITQNYADSYTQSSTQGHGATYDYSQTFAIETSFNNSLFILSFGKTVSQSSKVEWTESWDQSLTSSNTQTAAASITGPPCVVSGSTCNPVYNKSTQFSLYEDNLYGTFMLFPRN
jgi:hypothetical protein